MSLSPSTFVLTVGGWPGKGPSERGCGPSLNLIGGGRAMSDDQGENEGGYSVPLRRMMREREGRLQKLEQSGRLWGASVFGLDFT
jgi:hypothetical protein